MKYLIGIILVLSLTSCSDISTSDRYKKVFEDCMRTLEKSEFDYSKRINMCKSYALDIFYSGENK